MIYQLEAAVNRFRRALELWLKKRVLLLMYYFAETESALISVGQNARWRKMLLHAYGVQCGEEIFVAPGFRIWVNGPISIGNRISIGENSGIYAHGPINIGDDFLAAPGLLINNGTHELATLEPGAKPIRIGARVWCGANVTILAGANIGDDCIIGACSLVAGEVPPRSLVAGVPAKVIRGDIRPSEVEVWSPFSK
jgi:acetyltransferase-like isoleucine patch superfamily enzyme